MSLRYVISTAWSRKCKGNVKSNSMQFCNTVLPLRKFTPDDTVWSSSGDEGAGQGGLLTQSSEPRCIHKGDELHLHTGL